MEGEGAWTTSSGEGCFGRGGCGVWSALGNIGGFRPLFPHQSPLFPPSSLKFALPPPPTCLSPCATVQGFTQPFWSRPLGSVTFSIDTKLIMDARKVMLTTKCIQPVRVCARPGS
jgi:hypothetical protein